MMFICNVHANLKGTLCHRMELDPHANVTFQLTPNSVAGTLSHPHIDSTNP